MAPAAWMPACASRRHVIAVVELPRRHAFQSPAACDAGLLAPRSRRRKSAGDRAQVADQLLVRLVAVRRIGAQMADGRTVAAAQRTGKSAPAYGPRGGGQSRRSPRW